MKKIKVEQPRVINGVAYGPGEYEVDDAVEAEFARNDLPVSAPGFSPSRDLASLTKAELLEIAPPTAEVSPSMKKPEIIEAIRKS